MLATADPRSSASAPAGRARRFREIYLRELDFVWTVLSRLGVDDADVEDAAHDVFVVVHRQLDRFEGRSSERTWLYAIARRVAWHHRRAAHRRARRHAALATERSATADMDMEDALRAREARELLAAFLETLDRPQREAFVLGELEALPRPSLGRALGVRPGTAYSRLRAARAAFTAAFGPDGPRGELVSRHARTHEPAPRETRQRLWLALPGGLASTGASGLVAGTITVVVGLGLLGVIAAVLPPRDAMRGAKRDAITSTAPAVEREPSRVDAPRRSEPGTAAREPIAAPAAVVAPARARLAPRSSVARRGAAPPAASAPPSDPSPVEPSPPPRVQGVAPAVGTSVASTDELAEEAALLARARAAMREERWAEARAQLERHAERFASGALATERRASAVIVACEQGRAADALAEARALWSGRVPAAIRASLRSSCVGEHLDRAPMISAAPGGDQAQ